MWLLRQTLLRSVALIALLLTVVGIAVLLSPSSPEAADVDPAEWQAFLRSYVTPDGRVIDTANGDVSHTEGQGYGMLLATHYRDRATFDRLFAWTETTLERKSDHLHAWRYMPGAANPVADTNNATDGDLYIAWALIRAGERWPGGGYTAKGIAIARDILRLDVIDYHGNTVLLPGVKGFERPDGVVLNLSYYAFPAIRALARALPDPRWRRIEADGMKLIGAARFGMWDLPPDWLLLTPEGHIRPADGWPARFSWDAIRVPLQLAWAGVDSAPPLRNAVAFWTSPDLSIHPAAWASLSNREVADYAGGPGLTAIMDLSLVRLGAEAPADWPHVAQARDYYNAVLVLLTRMALAEMPKPARTAHRTSTASAAPVTPAGPTALAAAVNLSDVPQPATPLSGDVEAVVDSDELVPSGGYADAHVAVRLSSTDKAPRPQPPVASDAALQTAEAAFDPGAGQ